MDRKSVKMSMNIHRFEKHYPPTKLINIYRTHHSTAEYTLFSSTRGTFIQTDCILGHNTSLNKFKRIQIIQDMSSYHNNNNIKNQ